jgi:hypothetical protein
MVRDMNYVQLAVPLGLIIWLAVWPLRGGARWAHCAAVIGIVGLVGLSGQWGWPTAYAPYGLSVLAGLAVVFGRRRRVGRHDPPGWLGGMIAAVLAGVAFAGIGLLVQARLPPTDAVPLDMPFLGKALVIQGGGHWAINAQRTVLDADSPSLTSWKGAGHGVVLVAVNGWGRATGGVLNVAAPCAGHVVLVVQDDRLGQAVVLDCAGVWVVLSGMDAVTAKGDVAIGTKLGQAARLSVHAQTPGVAAHPFSGEALAMMLGNRYAVRGMVFSGGTPVP